MTEQHVLSGECGNVHTCAAAQALQEANPGQKCSMHNTYAKVGEIYYSLTAKAKIFIARFDKQVPREVCLADLKRQYTFPLQLELVRRQ